ncbi:MAG: Gfo/Idh/MocA family oxidoreductase [Opitutaceae bacterium]|nr:Gfo/Idh/MocA family oxidoreductase [Opitutaceae bacterium]
MKTQFNRREFLKTSAAATAAGWVLSSLTSCAGTSVARVRRPKPSDRINIGIIGFGTIAHGTVMNFLGDARVQVVAVADPVSDLPNYGYQGQLRGGRLVGQKKIEDYYAQYSAGGTFRGCRVYEDFRVMIDKEDLDTVYIATPDHWHCAAAVIAARKGLHIYGQKPLAVTVEEGQRIVAAVQKAGITWQTGSQQRSSVYFRTACEYVRNGRLGKLRRITVGLPDKGHNDWSKLGSRKKPEPIPKEVNFDLWLGPAAERPYSPALLPLNWRHNWDFSGGSVTDWGAHHFDIVQWALGLDDSGPVLVENVVAKLPPQSDLYNTPTSYAFEVVYANGVRLFVSSGAEEGILFEGEGDKSIFVKRDRIVIKPESLRQEKIRDEEIRLYESKVQEWNFIDCIYSGKPAICPADVSHRAITISHLANIAIRLGRSSVRWNPATERFVDDVVADRMLSRPMRKPYAV